MQDKKKGSALFVALMLSFIGLILIGGIAALWLRFHHITFPIRTYSSVREAAAGGIDLVRKLLDNGKFDITTCSTPCPDVTNSTYTCMIIINYRLLGSNTLHNNTVCVSFLGQIHLPGFAVTGVAYGGSGSLGSHGGELYAFNSTASASVGNGTLVSAYIEAVYLRIK
ncbi:MAG: hypothetical protein ACK40E_04180 [Caldimicrobium sp.]